MKHDEKVPVPTTFRGGRTALLGGAAACALGLVLFVAGIFLDRRQAFFSYLTAWAWAVSVALGALVFLLIGHAMRAGWPVALRRLTETIAWTLPLFALLFVPIAFGAKDLYVWTRHDVTDPHLLHAIHHKAAYLNVPFFLGRTVFYFAVWTVAIFLLRRWSILQDRDRAADVADRQVTLSSAMLPAVGLTLCFAAFDWLMSLEPAWFSTMYGIWFFAGGFHGALALLTIGAAWAAADDELLGRVLRTSHFYALGRLLFAFTVFWAYIAFFQAFIIYAANKPEEVTWYVTRTAGSWRGVGFVLIVGHFFVPFFGLLPYAVKRRSRYLLAMSAWILAMHFVDVYWNVMPVLHPSGLRPHWLDLAALLFVGGAGVAFGVFSLRGKWIAPGHDPRYAASARYYSA